MLFRSIADHANGDVRAVGHVIGAMRGKGRQVVCLEEGADSVVHSQVLPVPGRAAAAGACSRAGRVRASAWNRGGGRGSRPVRSAPVYFAGRPFARQGDTRSGMGPYLEGSIFSNACSLALTALSGDIVLLLPLAGHRTPRM